MCWYTQSLRRGNLRECQSHGDLSKSLAQVSTLARRQFHFNRYLNGCVCSDYHIMWESGPLCNHAYAFSHALVMADKLDIASAAVYPPKRVWRLRKRLILSQGQNMLYNSLSLGRLIKRLYGKSLTDETQWVRDDPSSVDGDIP